MVIKATTVKGPSIKHVGVAEAQTAGKSWVKKRRYKGARDFTPTGEVSVERPRPAVQRQGLRPERPARLCTAPGGASAPPSSPALRADPLQQAAPPGRPEAGGGRVGVTLRRCARGAGGHGGKRAAQRRRLPSAPPQRLGPLGGGHPQRLEELLAVGGQGADGAERPARGGGCGGGRGDERPDAAAD